MIVALVTAFCCARLGSLRFDYDFEAFFPNENHELDFYNAYRETFEHDNEFVLVAPENREGIFRKDYLLKIDSLSRLISHLKDVRQVISPTNLKLLDLSGLAPVQKPVLHFENEDRYKKDSIAIYKDPSLVGSFFPPDARSLAIFIKTEPSLSKAASDSLAKRITAITGSFKFEQVHIVGRIFAQAVYLSTLQREFLVFIALAFVIVVFFLWLTFRNLYGVIVPVTIVLVSIIWTLALMELLGKPIDLMTIMLPTMVFIAGSSDVVHFFSKYFEEQAKGTPEPKIFPLVMKEVGIPTFITLLTTAVGFLSLLFSSIRPIREFGIYTSIGISLAFILTYTLLPALLYFVRPRRIPRIYRPGHSRNLLLQRLLVTILRNQKRILVLSVFIIAISISGITHIRVNNILLEDLNERVKLKQDFNFFDNHYSGVRPFELDVKLRDSSASVWDYKVISQLNMLEEFIKKEYDPGFIVSPPSLVSAAYRHSNNPDGGFPGEEDYADLKKYFAGNRKNKELRRVATPDGLRCRISAKVRDVGSSKIEQHNRALQEFITGKMDPGLFHFSITGAAHLIDRNNQYMVENMLSGFLFSIIITGFLTFILHRNWKMVVIFLLPNVIPAVVVVGIMGFAGIELKAATSLVFSIAFGIATDDTIHFISRLKIERDKGSSLLYAFKRTFLETGRPVILTTFILAGGFVSLMTSSFESSYYFGFLICITLAVALLADLFLLPVLLFLLYRKKINGA